MAAKDYKLIVTGLTNTVWIGKELKTKGVMSSDRRAIPESEFIGAVLEWALGKAEKNKNNIISINNAGEVIAAIDDCLTIIEERKKKF